jgi:NAD(P)-dependent dehydrogenase (short-subunit alcohol dehydrogenase family)
MGKRQAGTIQLRSKLTRASVYITGGATGIGAASVRKFAANGFDVAVFDIHRLGDIGTVIS